MKLLTPLNPIDSSSKPETSAQHEPQGARASVEGLPSPAYDNSDCPPHSLAVDAAPTEEVFAALAADGRQAEREDVFPSFGGEGGESAVADYAVWVVPEDVFSGWAELGGAVQSRGEVSREEGPDFAFPETGGAHAEFPAMPGFREHNVHHERPDQHGDAQGVREHHGGLEAALQRDVEGREADARGVPVFACFAAGGEGA
ncbi:hypothetical protein V493_04863, partial [Pseudogymnoascus sp. VKM F-4281 (FW-2241)]